MEGDDDEDLEGKGDVTEKEIKEETNEEGENEKETPMEQQAEEDDVDPLDAYMEEVKQEVKKFNMGAMKGNDKVSWLEGCSTLTVSLYFTSTCSFLPFFIHSCASLLF